ncbi:MAG TPA: HNH endonuclease [Patescibacteria group bacterium]|nr:HNH endonuclease [Patescibacteria group bacterium]
MKFELSNLPRNCPDEDVIAEIKRVDVLVGKEKLTQTDYNKHAKMSSDGVKLRFGSWENALTTAGLGHKYIGTEITDKMRLQKAQQLTDQEVLKELKRVAEALDVKVIRRKDFDQHSEISSGTFISRFGGWQQALEKAGVGHKYSGTIITENMRKPKAKSLTNQDVLDELKRIAKLLNTESVSHEDVRHYSNVMSVGVATRRFGTWATAMEKAGLKISEKYNRAYSDEEYFENLLTVWTRYGRQPKYGEMDIQPSKIKANTYKGHFGSWRKALEAFVVRMNQEEKEFEEIIEHEKPTDIKSKTTKTVEIIKQTANTLIVEKREVGLGLRYKILSRDNFKCVKCGASPATDSQCRLHIDHKVPFSKGGRTIFENLQTLCEKCNLGKGNNFLN